VDNIGNVRGKLASKHPAAKTFVIASHIDTVVNAGKFDGPLGVLIGLDVVEKIFFYRDTLPFHIELIAFSDEEGIRFHTTFLGSKVVAGSFDKSLLQKKDASGTTLNAVIQKMGGDPERLHQDAIQPQDWLAYFEMHIEQGPVLYKQNIPVAVVTAIAGQKRIEVRFKGMAGHAGTVPMDMRRDALCCASEFVLEVEKFGLAKKEKIVATVGKLQVAHAASNVIPGEVACTLDLRSADKTTLDASYKSLQKMCASICNKRGIHFEWNLVQETEPVTCDQQMNKWLCQAIETAGYEVVKLVSGAGHDAVPVSKVAPVALLFVRCFEGISHNPLEDVELNDIAVAIEVADQFIHYLIHHNQ
ncbi:MAG: M20 family metallo-hydrolase, partial [Flavisolibacter sp.]|nr:M20 family metallo-hydrolase [Flavisolibacter sp.]